MTALPLVLAQAPADAVRPALLFAMILLPFVAAFVAVKVILRRRSRVEANALNELTGTTKGANLGGDAGASDDWLASALAADEADATTQSWSDALLGDEHVEPVKETQQGPRRSFLRRRDTTEAPAPVEASSAPVVEAAVAAPTFPVQSAPPAVQPLPTRTNAPSPVAPAEVTQPVPQSAISFERAEQPTSADWAESGSGTDEASSTWWDQVQGGNRE